MDNRDFDKIFKDGLDKTRSFDRAEESWQKLHPRLHPPKKRRRFVIWPFLAAAVVVLGLTTFWFYNQSASLQEDVAVLNEQLKQKEQQAPADIENKDAMISDEDAENESTQDEINTNANQSIAEQELLNIKKPKSPSNLTQEFNTIIIDDNAQIMDPPKSQQIIVNIDTKKEESILSPNTSNEIIQDGEKAKDNNFIVGIKELMNKYWLLKYDREVPTLALLESLKEESSDKKDKDKKSDKGFSVGLNGGMAWNAPIALGNRFEDDAFSVNQSSDDVSRSLTFYQFGVHGNYDLNKNWQLHCSVNRERTSLFYQGAFLIPSSEFSNSFDVDGANGSTYDPAVVSEYLSDNYDQTDIVQRNWLLNAGIRRRLFSIKKLNVFAGAYATTRFFQKQAISYSARAQNSPAGENLKATVTNRTDFAISPSFGIGSPIGNKFYWILEAKYDLHLSQDIQFQLPEFGLTLGAGYKF